MNLDQIKQVIAAGHVSAISLDTSVFDGQQRNLERGLLKRMQQFAGSGVQVVLSDVVIRELDAHLRKDAGEAQASIKRALKAMVQAWQVPGTTQDEIASQLFGSDSVESISRKRLDSFAVGIGAVIAEAGDHVAVRDLIERYFAHDAPFGDKETKKNEFPDALAVLTLESWAVKNDAYVLVVTKDSDWKAYCATSARLIGVDDLATALGCFQREAADYDCRQLLQQFLAGDPLGIEKAVGVAINEQGWKIEFIPVADSQFYFEEDVTETEFELIAVQGVGCDEAFDPVEYADDYIVVRILVDALAHITCTFTFDMWDGIDKEYMSMGSGSATATEQVGIEVLVTFAGRVPDRARIEEIEVLSKREHVSFGEIEPDWMSNPDNFDE